MYKNIVLCSDGTGNRDVKARGSNVFKLYEAVDIQGYKKDRSVPVQVAYYDDGVGSDSVPILRILGGAFGFGIARKVRDLYTQLAQVYEPGDRVFLFGFSRGAYTVRTLSGMIQYCGVVDRRKYPGAQLDQKVWECWREFRGTFARFVSEAARRGENATQREDDVSGKSAEDAVRRRGLGAVEDDRLAPKGRVDIHFIGVWDTVCAIGVPFDELRDFLNYFVYPIRFSDLVPGDQVTFARHALALDDERRTFWPEMWDEREARPGQIEQVWFAGAHSNVGGGYPKQGMSLVSLDWMMAHAESAGLRFIPTTREFVRSRQDAHDKLYDSRSGLGVYYRWNPRDVVRLCRAHGLEKPRVHLSVFERIARGSADYAPGNLPFDVDVVTTPDSNVPSWPRQGTNASIAQRLTSAAEKRGPGGSLLAQQRSTLLAGKLSYHAFLVATVTILVAAIVSREGLEIPSLLKGVVPFGDTVAAGVDRVRGYVPPNWRSVPSSLLVAAFFSSAGLAWMLSYLVDRRQRREYTDFWHELRDGIQHDLDQPTETI